MVFVGETPPPPQKGVHMDATPTGKAIYWLGYNAFRRGLSLAEAVREAIEFVGDSSDDLDDITNSVHAGWDYSSVTAYRAARF